MDPATKEAGLTKDRLRDQFKIPNHIATANLGGAAHVPCLVYDFLFFGEELVQVINRVRKFFQELRLSGLAFLCLDQVHYINGRTVAFEQIVKVQRSGAEERINYIQVYIRFR